MKLRESPPFSAAEEKLPNSAHLRAFSDTAKNRLGVWVSTHHVVIVETKPQAQQK
jgi:hypothetical protein